MGTTGEFALTDEARAKLARVSTATLTSQLLHRGFRNTFIAGLIPMRPDLRMVGRAFTLRYAPSREDMDLNVDFNNEVNVQRRAVEAIGPGQVLVIDARGEVRSASFGHIISTRIMKRGAAGLVTDGALRDSGEIRRLDLPSYCRGAHATTSSLMHHPVDMQVPIGCGGVLVMPGDVIVGDLEGVVVIPSALAEEVAHEAFEQEWLEEYLTERVASGDSIRGVYPPDDRTRAEYREWRRRRSEADRQEG
jgi:regulator of RNase E activity RraA